MNPGLRQRIAWSMDSGRSPTRSLSAVVPGMLIRADRPHDVRSCEETFKDVAHTTRRSRIQVRRAGQDAEIAADQIRAKSIIEYDH